MKLRILRNKARLNQGINTVLIGKTGNLRFRKEFAEKFKFSKNEHWVIGINEEEPEIEHIYFSRAKGSSKTDLWRLAYLNGNWFINVHSIVEELNLKKPIKCKIEQFKAQEFDGFRLLLPKEK